MLTDLWMGLHLVCGVYWFEGQRKRLAQGTTVPGHNHKPPQLSETLIKYNDPGIALTGLKWFAVFPRQKCCPFAKITCCRCHNKRVLSAEGPWLLAVWRARTLRGLELADRIVLYLCSHRLHPGIGYYFDWKGEHGQQPGKEAVCLIPLSMFNVYPESEVISQLIFCDSFPSAAPRSQPRLTLCVLHCECVPGQAVNKTN